MTSKVRIIGVVFFGLARALHLVLGVRDCCRFTPTCSQYGAEAVSRHGWLKGSGLLFGRLFRCHPLNRNWGEDPVPLKK